VLIANDLFLYPSYFLQLELFWVYYDVQKAIK